ncbi:hypothetical protein SEA_PICARD_50 [Streptomyces phage Picard]|uniref:Uncharacterized protein n=1 Tax=Streptomyces phage Picard TaxID=1920311 RepID=A0A1J0MC33_9CAUD|nr:hypothetical protein HOR45_gp50 [Streptomyces phage Picard]APD18579.1 hypothetical protein SEA_PICARD_50 [Streptomyces phage Picard]
MTPKRRDRADRRKVVDVLLARLDRLSDAEAALLREHVLTEQRLADEQRATLTATKRARTKEQRTAEAALAAAEERAQAAEQRLAAAEERAQEARRVAGEQHAAVSRVVALVDHRDAVPAPAVWAAIDADPAEHRKAAGLADRWRADADARAPFLAAANSTTAVLAEQQRDHDIALATERRNVADATRQIRAERHRARRYRAAWLAARRARRAVRAALPTEPRPRLGIGLDLAYANGRHDLAERILYALAHPPKENRTA